MPEGPRETRRAKKGAPAGASLHATYAHSTTPSPPASATRQELAKRAAAYAMDRVAEPLPALAVTTSVPASWIRAVRAATVAGGRPTLGLAWEINGRIVTPAWPPTTGKSTAPASTPAASATNALARTTSSVVTPNSLRGSNTPAALRISAAMGTVELTGLEMIATSARGQYRATPCASVATIPALMLNKSSRVMPGLRGTPAGITTSAAPASAAPSSASPVCAVTRAGVSMWARSAATPGVPTTS